MTLPLTAGGVRTCCRRGRLQGASAPSAAPKSRLSSLSRNEW